MIWSRRDIGIAFCFALLAALLLLVCPGRGTAAEPALEEVTFLASFDRTEQRYVISLPEKLAADGVDLLIALHGHGSDRWQFAKGDIAEARASRDAAQKYQMIFVSPDYRAKTSWMGPAAEADLVQIITDLKQRYPVRRVIVSGASMGGSSALTFAALHPELTDGVVAMNGTANHLEYERFQDAIAASFGGSKLTQTAEYKKRSAEYWPERFVMPVALTVGGNDTVVPPQSVQRLAAVLKKLERPVLLIDRPTGGHSTTYDDAKAAFEFVLDRME